MTDPPWRIGSPSFSRRNTSQGSSVRPSAAASAMSGGCSRCREDGLPNPAGGLAVDPPELEPFLGLRAVVRDDGPELVPVGLGVAPFASGRIEPERRVGQGEPQLPDPGHVDSEELLAQLLARLRLDPPVDVAVLRSVAVRLVHLHHWPTPATELLSFSSASAGSVDG